MLRRLSHWELSLWRTDRFGRRGPTVVVRFFGVLIRGVLSDTIWIRAGHMTYLSLLHMVPLGALGLAVSSRLGWEDVLIAWIQRRLSPTAPELAANLVAAMEKLDLVSFGYLGLAGIIVAGLFALTQLEHDLDDIWGVSGSRPLWKSLFLLYPLAVIVAPALAALALASGALAEAQSRIWIAHLADWGSLGGWLHGWLTNLPVIFHVIPYALTWLMLTAVYYMVPSGPVRLRSAMFGGVIAGVIWQAAQSLYINYQFASATFRESWGYLAQIPLLLLWIFISWLVLFLGAELAFVWQHRRAFMPKWPVESVSIYIRERTLLEIISRIQSSTRDFPDGVTTLWLSTQLRAPWRLVERLACDLAEISVLERRRFHRHVRYRPVADDPGWPGDDLLSRWRNHGVPLPLDVSKPEPSASPPPVDSSCSGSP